MGVISYLSQCTGGDTIVATNKHLAKYVYGKLDSVSYAYNGRAFYKSDSNTYSAISATVVAGTRPVYLDMTERTSSTFGEVDIDTAVEATTKDVRFLSPELSGDISWFVEISANAAAVYGGTLYQCGTSTAVLIPWDGTSEAACCLVKPGSTCETASKFVEVVKA